MHCIHKNLQQTCRVRLQGRWHKTMTAIRVGISGWTYEPWRKIFYPSGLVQKRELEYASRKVNSIEINGTFYSMQRPKSYESWYTRTPDDFMFSLKGPKHITHERRLKDVATPVANFLASGLLCLKQKLGPILWQFPPTMPFNPDLFEEFMTMLPHDTLQAAEIAQGHSDWMKDRCYLSAETSYPMRHAIEARHDSFKDPEFVALARKYHIAIVVGDTAGRWPLIEDLTADFVYIRLHGDETIYPDGYTDEALQFWAQRIFTWARGEQPDDARVISPVAPALKPRDVFAYADDDTKTNAPRDAMKLWTFLDGKIPSDAETGIEIKKPRAKSAPKKAAPPQNTPKSKPPHADL